MSSLNLDHHNTLRLLNHQSDLKKAADILKTGGIVALPTETVYGLAANGFSSEAIAKVFMAKNRPNNNPLILHVKDQNDAFLLFDFSSLPAVVERRFMLLAAHFWPGPITIVSKKAAHVPNLATANLSSVAVRVPKNQVTQSILANLDFPLVMPSANLSTRPSPTSAEHVLTTLDKKIDAVVDDGNCEVGIESTVIKIDAHQATILRPGMVTKEEIESCLDELVVYATTTKNQQPLAPGQCYLHYSPAVKAVKLISLSEANLYWHDDHIILATMNDYHYLESMFNKRDFTNYILSDEPKLYAKELYHALYLCEGSPDKHLIIVRPSMDGLEWQAILDRLNRSAGLSNT